MEDLVGTAIDSITGGCVSCIENAILPIDKLPQLVQNAVSAGGVALTDVGDEISAPNGGTTISDSIKLR